jgi:hypothetical protein
MLRHTLTLAAAAALVAAAGAEASAQNLSTPSDQAPTRAGTRGATFLTIPLGARANAMAGAVTATEDGPEAWYWNPAGATTSEHFAVTASRQELYKSLDISMNHFAASLPLLGGVVGANVTSLSSGDIPRTDESDPTGGGQNGSTFSWSSTSIGLGYARRLTDRLEVGAVTKFVNEGITDASTSWVALDAGTRFRTGLYGLTIGATLSNIGPTGKATGPAIARNQARGDNFPELTHLELTTRGTELPTLFRFSVASDLLGRSESLLGHGAGRNSLRAEAAFQNSTDSPIQFAGGVEYSYSNFVFLRAGQRVYNDQRAHGASNYGLSFGGGLQVPIQGREMRFDYAYTSLGDLQNVQVFTFGFGR